ncbi:hypothetical protein BDQ17DRAFT_1429685 [Cyathus striatus]|nr:hypothetical protein BDQ17DRAFT_1429685 [Cyathus striatus]
MSSLTTPGHVQEPTTASTLVDHGEANGSMQEQLEESTVPRAPSPFSNQPQEKPYAVKREGTLKPSALPHTIPPDHLYRTLVVCFDGTGDQFDADNSNIVQLVSLLKKNDRTKQMVYYQPGIGTYTSPTLTTPVMSKLSKMLDEAVAWNLDSHVMNGYEFLMQNYLEGDKICIFGFSRGAYTARSLAGMLHKVGLLPANNSQQVPFAYKMYTRTDDVGWEQSNEFKKAFCIDVKIEFLGVWDTVDSVGLIPKRLPFTTSNTIVRNFRHAIALDERRSKFKANLWNRPNSHERKLGLGAPIAPSNSSPPNTRDSIAKDSIAKESVESARSGIEVKPRKKSTGVSESEDDRRLTQMERMYSEKSEKLTDIEEVWFAGCHCDVGGGSVSNKTRYSLARIPLRWMIRECFKTGSGIMFDSESLKTIGLDPSTLYPFVTPRPPPASLGTNKIEKHPAVPIPLRLQARLKKKDKIPELNPESKHVPPPFLSEEDEEIRDALSPKYDQLKLKKTWWILEIIPMQLRYQRGDDKWITKLTCNLGRARFIPKQNSNGVRVHRSVKQRMEAEFDGFLGKKYKPKAHFKVEPTWVD